MTIFDEAISHFKYGLSHDIFKPPVTRYANIAIAAIERQQPMSVNHEKTFWSYRHYCPACAGQLLIEDIRYCDKCGQRLKWH